MGTCSDAANTLCNTAKSTSYIVLTMCHVRGLFALVWHCSCGITASHTAATRLHPSGFPADSCRFLQCMTAHFLDVL